MPIVSAEEVFKASDDSTEAETAMVRAEESYLLRKAVEMLPSEQREAVVLRYFADLTIPEIAKLTGQREGTIKSRLSRATDRLKEILHNQEKIGE